MRLWSSTLLAAAVLTAIPSYARTDSPEASSLEVYVNDRDGRFVGGLGPRDLELRVDGEVVETTWREVRGEPVTFVVFVDNLHISRPTRNRAIEEVRSFLRGRLRGGDQVMLASYDGRIRVRHKASRDASDVEQALDRMSREPSLGHLLENRERQVRTEMLTFSDVHQQFFGEETRTRCPSQMGQIATRYAEQIYDQVRASVSALATFVATLTKLPGRKVVIHLSDGIPFQPGVEMFEFLNQFCGSADQSFQDTAEPTDRRPLGVATTDPVSDADVYDTRSGSLESTSLNTTALFDDLTRRANAHRVTVFAVEATGARLYSLADSRRLEHRLQSRRGDEARWSNLRNSLTAMSERTGGRAILGTSELAAQLEAVGRDLDAYYSPEYVLPKTEAARSFKVAVSVKSPGIALRHRASLHHESLDDEVAARTQAVLLYGDAVNPLGVKAELGGFRPSGIVHMVPIRLRVPFGKLTLQASGEAHQGRFRVFVAARDQDGRMAQVRTSTVKVDIPAGELEDALSKSYLYEVKMLLGIGAHEIAVCVWDDLGSVASFVTGKVDVPAIGRP